MTRSVVLDARERQALLERYRKAPDPDVRFRSHILLLLADGRPWEEAVALLFCSSRTIDRWVNRLRAEGVEAVVGRKPGRPFRFASRWAALAVAWVASSSLREFGFLRSPWCCEAVAILMRRRHGLVVGRETVRLWLRRGGMVYRRPRPVLKPADEARESRLDELRALLAELPHDETPCSRTRSTSTPIPRSAPCGRPEDARPGSRCRGTTRSASLDFSPWN
jgi:transposase